MTIQPNGSAKHGPKSLDQALTLFMDEIASARVAAMLVLVHHVETKQDGRSDVSSAEFMEAVGQLQFAATAIQDVKKLKLDPFRVSLPEALQKQQDELRSALNDLNRMTRNCVIDDGKLVGFDPSGDMHALCWQRIVRGITALGHGLKGFFLELTDKEKADDLDNTSTIAAEIGKIGRVINMVATNASIEAARAGDAGKGFTVIADEVKVLSSRVSSLSVSLTDRLNVT